MAENTAPNAAAPTTEADPIQNVKAEFNRKLSSLEESNKALMARIEAFTKASAPAPTEPAPKNIGSLLYEDADKYAEAVMQKAEQAATQRFEALTRQQTEQANVVGKLYRDFPELSDPANPYTKAVIERHKQLSMSEQQDPRNLRLIALETAAEMEILPQGKRKSVEPEPSVYGNGNSQRARDVSVDDKTLEFARLLKMDVNDPKVVERLKERAKNVKRG